MFLENACLTWSHEQLLSYCYFSLILNKKLKTNGEYASAIRQNTLIFIIQSTKLSLSKFYILKRFVNTLQFKSFFLNCNFKNVISILCSPMWHLFDQKYREATLQKNKTCFCWFYHEYKCIFLLHQISILE